MGNRVFTKLTSPRALAKFPLFVFAADADCGGGIGCFGNRDDGSPRTRADFKELCLNIARDSAVDGILLSPASAEKMVLEERCFDRLQAQPLVRFNAETAFWTPRHGQYRMAPSIPFSLISPDDEKLSWGTPLGLYSLTLNNDAATDHVAIQTYFDFARQLGEHSRWSHVLEVLPPQQPNGTWQMQSEFLADSIVRILSQSSRRMRPVVVQTAFTNSKTWRELCEFDPEIVIGALGGPRLSALETLGLAENVISNGGRAIFFGRTIFHDPKPRTLCRLLREILDRKTNTMAAYEQYCEAVEESDKIKVAAPFEGRITVGDEGENLESGAEEEALQAKVSRRSNRKHSEKIAA